MTNKISIAGKLLALLCLLAGWTCYGFAATAAGVLHPIAWVDVNGKQLSNPTIIFNGDMIRTGVSAARLEAAGFAILLDKETTALVQDDQLRIICGSAVVKTLQGMSTRVGNIVMKPLGPSARFEVRRQGESLQITALDGSLNLSNGSRNIILSRGQRLMLSCSRCIQDASPGKVADAQADCSLPLDLAVQAAPERGPVIAFIAAAAGGPAIVLPLADNHPISPDHP